MHVVALSPSPGIRPLPAVTVVSAQTAVAHREIRAREVGAGYGVGYGRTRYQAGAAFVPRFRIA